MNLLSLSIEIILLIVAIFGTVLVVCLMKLLYNILSELRRTRLINLISPIINEIDHFLCIDNNFNNIFTKSNNNFTDDAALTMGRLEVLHSNISTLKLLLKNKSHMHAQIENLEVLVDEVIIFAARKFDIKLAEIGELMHSEISGLIKTNSTPIEIKKDIQLMQIRFKEFKLNFFNDLSVSYV